MCEAGLHARLLQRCSAALADEDHSLHPPLQRMFERLASQALEPMVLRLVNSFSYLRVSKRQFGASSHLRREFYDPFRPCGEACLLRYSGSWNRVWKVGRKCKTWLRRLGEFSDMLSHREKWMKSEDVVSLPSMHELLGPIPSTTKNKKFSFMDLIELNMDKLQNQLFRSGTPWFLALVSLGWDPP